MPRPSRHLTHYARKLYAAGWPSGVIISEMGLDSYDLLARLLWPERERARQALQKAVYRGSVRRPDSCEDCGADGKIQGHHFDYSRPLDVHWLCSRCHCHRHIGATRAPGEPIDPEVRKAVWAVSLAAQLDPADLLALQSIPEIVNEYRGWLGLNRADIDRLIDGEKAA